MRLPRSGVDSRCSKIISQLHRGPRVRKVSAPKWDGPDRRWQRMSVCVNAFLPMSSAFLGPSGERACPHKNLMKSLSCGLKSASGKPECGFESGRGHHPRLLRGDRAIGDFSNHTTADAAHRVARLGYISVTMPLQNCWPLPVSTSYLRTNESLPSLAMR